MALSFLFESGILMLFIGSANALVNVVISTGLTIEGIFYRLNNERLVINSRINCALKCQSQWNCFFFAIGSENSCLLFTNETNGGFEIYYRHPIVTVEIKSNAYPSTVPGYFRINNKQHGIHDRGISTMELSSNKSDLTNFKAYNTIQRTYSIINDLKGLAAGSIVAGTSVEELLNYLYKIKQPLKEIGLDFTDPVIWITVCFLWIKGHPNKTFLRIKPAENGDLRCKVRIYHDPAADYTFVSSMETMYD